jgi:hypothetical protein
MAQFKPGETGNPKGRPPKPRTGPNKLRDKLLSEAPAILEALVAQARIGDVAAAKLVLDRCLPCLRPQDQAVNLPLGSDIADAGRAVLGAVGSGALTPDQAASLASVLASLVRIRETVELEQRITALEDRANGNQS